MLYYIKRKPKEVGVYLTVILGGFSPAPFLVLKCQESFIFLGPTTIGLLRNLKYERMLRCLRFYKKQMN